MTAPLKPQPALLVASVLGQTEELVERGVRGFAEQHGEPAYISEPLLFDSTDFYSAELGPSPRRRIMAVLPLQADPACLPDVKRAAARLEVTLGRPGGGRTVNIDPGLLNEQQLVLASTKPRAHRIYLGRGVYGDLMLLSRQGTFVPLPWTYPDYAAGPLLEIFGRLRELYLSARRLPGGQL